MNVNIVLFFAQNNWLYLENFCDRIDEVLRKQKFLV